jgi:hypothetical protein
VKFYYRFPIGDPMYSQDAPTFICAGRWAHLYNAKYHVWFVVNPRPVNLNRSVTELVSIRMKDFIQNTGSRAWLEIIEDILCIRVKHIAMWLRQKVRPLRHAKWLMYLQEIDDRQDYSEWEEYCQPPEWGISPQEAETRERSRQ